MTLILIALGGACGSVLRYLSFNLVMGLMHNRSILSIFPWGTLFVNVFGSMMAGAVYYVSIKHLSHLSDHHRAMIFVGFFGGYTTFSSFSLEVFRFVNSEQYFHAAVYILASVVLSISALFLGYYLTKMVLS